MKPIISICIVTYNHEQYIADCINSVLQQDPGVPFEILIGNDASTDQTHSIIDELSKKNPNKIKYINNTKNIGVFENTKSLVKQAQGDFITHLDGDDFWQVGKLKAQLEFLSNHQDCSACYTNAWIVDDKLTPIGVFNKNIPEIFDLSFLLRKGNFINHSSIFYRAVHKKCVLDNASNFIDYKIHICLSISGKLGYIDIPYVTYRHKSSQSFVKKSNNIVRQLYFEALLYAIQNNTLGKKAEIIIISNFIGKLLKESLIRKDMRYFINWQKTIFKHCRQTYVPSLIFGIAQGMKMIVSSVLRKIYKTLKIGGELYVSENR